ncbi:MAG: hypothetical protein LBV38_07530 [Alistipes sp.]|jgi:hypothetical protein|nr:hypothetical protein [Alistipes sp.]
MTVITLCGVYSLLFALFHAGFWKMFGWSKDFANFSDIEAFSLDRRIMHILNIMLLCCFAGVALACFLFPADLLGTRFGLAFMSFWAIFWLVRAALQPVFLGGGKPLLSIPMTALFLVGALLFALPVFNGLF